MSNDFIYNKEVQYLRKGKWRHYELTIHIVRRCQDKLVAILNDLGDKTVSHKLGIYGYEHYNDCVSLISRNDIHLIKFESLAQVPSLTQLLSKYIKDVSFKIQLKACSFVHSLLIVNEWYTLHVQTNRICFTTVRGCRMVTRWKRSNIGRCFFEENALNVEIIYNKDKGLYSFYRDELFPLDKIFKAIQNLKFEFPLPRPANLTSTPRRSGSVDLKRITSWGSRIIRDRTYSSSRVDDSYSNEDSSPPSTPCSPIFTFSQSDPVTFSKCYSHIDEKDEESEELMFQLDSTDPEKLTYGLDSKIDEFIHPSTLEGISHHAEGCIDSDKPSLRKFNTIKYVTLERFPFESDQRNQEKLSTDLSSNGDSDRPKVYIHNPNTHDNSSKGDCYQTLDYLKHHRKTCSEASFTQHQQGGSREGAISQSADTTPSHMSTLLIPLTDSTSQSSSPNVRLSSSNASSKSNYQEDGDVDPPSKRPAVSLTLTDAFLEHDYYNIMHISDRSEDSLLKYPFTANGDSHYYNLAWSLSPANDLPRLKFQSPSLVTSGDSLQYVKLDFQDKIYSQISKKAAATVNYTEINIHHTEVLKDLDERMRDLVAKKKRPNFLKSIFKK